MITVVKRNSEFELFNPDKINICVERACKGLEGVSASEIVLDAQLQLYDGISTKDINKQLSLSAQSKTYLEPNYSNVAARILLQDIYKDAFVRKFDEVDFFAVYRESFIANIKKGVSYGVYSERLLDYDLGFLADQIVPARDELFKYSGLLNLYDRYLTKYKGELLESPQIFYMRIAMGLSRSKEEALELYNTYSQHLASPSTPTLFNSGTVSNQLSSCYLTRIEDSIDGIFDGIWQEARKSKFAGGLGLHFSSVRAKGSFIKGTNGISSGPIPYLKIINDMVVAVDQGGKRKGSCCVYMEPWHLDIEEFLELRSVTGEERRRCHDLNTALWVPDLFLERVEANEGWTLFDPAEVPDLVDLSGADFNKRYAFYEKEAMKGKIRSKSLRARDLFKQWLKAIYETSHPWLCFKDVSNERYANKHAGNLYGSNLCCVTGDQLVPTQYGLVRVDQLASHYEGRALRVPGLEKEVVTSPMALTIKNAPILEVTLTNGMEHKVTYDHPLWVKDIGWVEAQYLNPGDVVLIQQVAGWSTKDFDKEKYDVGFVIGLIAGDGTFNNTGSCCVDLWGCNDEVINSVSDRVSSIFKRYSGENRSKFNACKTGTSTVTKVRYSSKELGNILSREFNFTKDTKLQVPQQVLADKSMSAGYLAGLFYADSTVQSVGGQGVSASLANNSKELLKTVQIILSNFGITSRIRVLQKEGMRTLPNGKGGYSDYQCKTTYRLMVTSIRCCKLLEEVTGIGTSRQNSDYVNQLDKEGYTVKRYSEIESVVRVGNEDTYCLMVNEDNRAWTCNGLITKNTEILQHTIPSEYSGEFGQKTKIGETSVCTLASVCLPNHLIADGTIYSIDWNKLRNTIRSVMRGLDNAIDLNYYPTEEAKNSAINYRFLGLGNMGFADLCNKLNIIQDSEQGVHLAHNVAEFVTYCAIEASSDLAKERGTYPKYENSSWSQGILPIDTFNAFVKRSNNKKLLKNINYESIVNWDELREKVVKQGMRNALTCAVAPNASIAYQLGVQQSIEPYFSVIYSYENKSGRYYIIDETFVSDMKGIGLWNRTFAELVKYHDGNLNHPDFASVPEHYKTKYARVFDRDMYKLIDANAARQKFYDQGISFNLYSNKESLEYIRDIYLYCWKMGLKTTYYLRQEASTRITKVSAPFINKQKQAPSEAEKLACSIQNPEGCEMCEG